MNMRYHRPYVGLDWIRCEKVYEGLSWEEWRQLCSNIKRWCSDNVTGMWNLQIQQLPAYVYNRFYITVQPTRNIVVHFAKTIDAAKFNVMF